MTSTAMVEQLARVVPLRQSNSDDIGLGVIGRPRDAEPVLGGDEADVVEDAAAACGFVPAVVDVPEDQGKEPPSPCGATTDVASQLAGDDDCEGNGGETYQYQPLQIPASEIPFEQGPDFTFDLGQPPDADVAIADEVPGANVEAYCENSVGSTDAIASEAAGSEQFSFWETPYDAAVYLEHKVEAECEHAGNDIVVDVANEPAALQDLSDEAIGVVQPQAGAVHLSQPARNSASEEPIDGVNCSEKN
jgi:hypothetical protein